MPNTRIIIDNDTFEIYSVRKDGKIYFWNTQNNEEQFTSTMTELHQKLDNGTWTLSDE